MISNPAAMCAEELSQSVKLHECSQMIEPNLQSAFCSRKLKLSVVLLHWPRKQRTQPHTPGTTWCDCEAELEHPPPSCCSASAEYSLLFEGLGQDVKSLITFTTIPSMSSFRLIILSAPAHSYQSLSGSPPLLLLPFTPSWICFQSVSLALFPPAF